MSSRDSNWVPFNNHFSLETVRNQKDPCWESMDPDRSKKSCVWPRQCESDTSNGHCHDRAAKIPLPQIQSFASHSILKEMDNLLVVLFGNVLALWCILMMHHPMDQSTRLWNYFTPTLLSLASGMMNFSTVMIALWFLICTCKQATHHQWSWYLGSWCHCLCSPTCRVWLPDGDASAP